MALKLAPLLVQYLHIHKRLDLPGIGSFIIKDSGQNESDHHKHANQQHTESVFFESNTAVKQSPDLVQFISEQTGKIKALATADLESHLALAQQFLNIGNPFLFEGIGQLVKIRSGEFALTPLPGMAEKTKEHVLKEKPESYTPGNIKGDYSKNFYAGKLRPKYRKLLVVILVLAGLALAVWGGYTVYKMTKDKKAPSVEDRKNKATAPVMVQDTTNHQKDSLPRPVQSLSPGMQKFVLETAPAKRAFERYGRLKTFQWNVQMETSDSVSYKLYMLLPATAADTSRILDSLSRLNGRRVYIE